MPESRQYNTAIPVASVEQEMEIVYLTHCYCGGSFGKEKETEKAKEEKFIIHKNKN
jgi:hypothetical protein